MHGTSKIQTDWTIFLAIMMIILLIIIITVIAVVVVIFNKLKGSVKEPNILIYFFFSAHQSMVFYFRCSVYWWKGSVIF